MHSYFHSQCTSFGYISSSWLSPRSPNALAMRCLLACLAASFSPSLSLPPSLPPSSFLSSSFFLPRLSSCLLPSVSFLLSLSSLSLLSPSLSLYPLSLSLTPLSHSLGGLRSSLLTPGDFPYHRRTGRVWCGCVWCFSGQHVGISARPWIYPWCGWHTGYSTALTLWRYDAASPILSLPVYFSESPCPSV